MDCPSGAKSKPGVDEPSRCTIFSYLGLSRQVGQEERRPAAAEATACSSDPTATTRTKSYGYDATGARLTMSDKLAGTTTEHTYAYDPRGSVSLLLNADGDVKTSYGYLPYGESDRDGENPDPLTHEATSTDVRDPSNAYRYTGKRTDTGSNTLDMGARRYSPNPGGFLQQDAYNDALGDMGLSTDPLTQNRYSLAGGNPISFNELDGHKAVANQQLSAANQNISGDSMGTQSGANTGSQDRTYQTTMGTENAIAHDLANGRVPRVPGLQLSDQEIAKFRRNARNEGALENLADMQSLKHGTYHPEVQGTGTLLDLVLAVAPIPGCKIPGVKQACQKAIKAGQHVFSHAAAWAAAKQHAKRLAAEGKPSTMVAAARERGTGTTGYGVNRTHSEVPPELKGRVPEDSIVPRRTTANCAEVAACTAAVREGADPDDLVVKTVRGRGSRFGKVEAPCPNCERWVPNQAWWKFW